MNSNDGLRKTVDHLWSFLDDLAESDPAAYKDFVKEQLKDGPGALSDRKLSSQKNKKDVEKKKPKSIILPFKSALTENSLLPEDIEGTEDNIRLCSSTDCNYAPQKKCLIEEVKESPNYLLKKNGSGIILEISLPLLDSIQDVKVDISAKECVLDCPEYALQVQFPEPVVSDNYRAKWSKRRKKLIISE